MVWYIAFVAIVNLGLGYALAVYLGVWRNRHAVIVQAHDSASHSAEPNAERLKTALGPNAREEFSVVAIDASPSTEGLSPDDIDQLTGLKTRAHMEQRLSEMALAHADHQPMTVALIEVDHAAGGAEACEDRLLRGIADTVRNMLSDVQAAGRFSDQQILLLMPDDNLQHATALTEQVRQRVATTQYLADGKEIQTTVTCALAQLSADQSAKELLEFLSETLDEANRYGGNRTFMHDGKSPTPVVPPELNFAPQTCLI
jgi:diguanylate cyclase (GGDEF)-like protein